MLVVPIEVDADDVAQVAAVTAICLFSLWLNRKFYAHHLLKAARILKSVLSSDRKILGNDSTPPITTPPNGPWDREKKKTIAIIAEERRDELKKTALDQKEMLCEWQRDKIQPFDRSTRWRCPRCRGVVVTDLHYPPTYCMKNQQSDLKL